MERRTKKGCTIRRPAHETTTGIYIKPTTVSSQKNARTGVSMREQATAGERELWITNFPSLTEPLGEEESFDTWEEFCDTLRSFYERDDKKSVPGWSAATFVGGKRGNENVREINCVVFDVRHRNDELGGRRRVLVVEGHDGVTAGGFSAAYLMDPSYSPQA